MAKDKVTFPQRQTVKPQQNKNGKPEDTKPEDNVEKTDEVKTDEVTPTQNDKPQDTEKNKNEQDSVQNPVPEENKLVDQDQLKDGNPTPSDDPTPNGDEDETGDDENKNIEYGSAILDFKNRRVDGVANTGRVNPVIIAVTNCFEYGMDKEITKQFISYVKNEDDKLIITDISVSTLPDNKIELFKDIVRVLQHPAAEPKVEFAKLKAHKEFIALL